MFNEDKAPNGLNRYGRSTSLRTHLRTINTMAGYTLADYDTDEPVIAPSRNTRLPYTKVLTATMEQAVQHYARKEQS